MLTGWLKTLQTAELLGLTRKHVADLIRTGRLEAARCGVSHYRVRAAVVEAYLARRGEP